MRAGACRRRAIPQLIRDALASVPRSRDSDAVSRLTDTGRGAPATIATKRPTAQVPRSVMDIGYSSRRMLAALVGERRSVRSTQDRRPSANANLNLRPVLPVCQTASRNDANPGFLCNGSRAKTKTCTGDIRKHVHVCRNAQLHAALRVRVTRTAVYRSMPPKHTYFTCTNSSMPYIEPSRPRPDCFTPPKGATSVVMSPVLTPTIPYSSASATRQIRPISRE